ncbi:MAG: efflux RND transporter periplasmic adaptor subunit [Halothiobacillaceae bacterium]
MTHRSLLLSLALSLAAGLTQAADTLTLSPTQIEALGLRFATPTAAQASYGAAWPGRVVLPPDGHELLVAPLAGRVTRVHASTGKTVAAGTPLVTLFSPTLVQLVQDYRSARVNEDLARQTLVREQRLAKEGIGIERRVREAESALRRANVETQGLAARLKLAGMDPDHLPADGTGLAELTLRAPRDGALLMLNAAPGMWLEEGQATAELAYTNRRWIETEVPLEQAALLRPGQSARILPGDVDGTLLAVGLTADPERQTVRVRVELDNGSALRPGQRVQVRFSETGACWQVAASAIVRIDSQDMVFVQREQTLLPIPVVQQGRDGNTILVEGKLKADDRVVSQGAIALKSAWQARGGTE